MPSEVTGEFVKGGGDTGSLGKNSSERNAKATRLGLSLGRRGEPFQERRHLPGAQFPRVPSRVAADGSVDPADVSVLLGRGNRSLAQRLANPFQQLGGCGRNGNTGHGIAGQPFGCAGVGQDRVIR
jgi:hypothetical protein